MVVPTRRTQIAARLDQIEAEHELTVLYACESGSRAWGFPSADSDYDVRFVYVHPRDWYLSIDLERRDDTIDPPIVDAVDPHGWDLRKALYLFRDANPTLLEWLHSPIVYREDEAVMARWRDLIPDYYTPRAAGHAYRGMARSVAKQNLSEEPIPHKAYLYVLRALLAVRWVEQDRGPVPVEFERLLDAVDLDADLRDAIEALLAQKRAGTEQDAGPHLPVIHAFIDAELEQQAALQFPEGPERPGTEPLNTFFRAVPSAPTPRFS
jgi:predicted nucleotidyltransferase